MSRCRYCKNIIWPWQSYFTKPEIEQDDYHTILINPEYDRWMHEGCYFRTHTTNQIQQIKED